MQYLPHLGDLLILGRAEAVMGFLLIKEAFVMTLALGKVPFFNPSVEISLYSAGPWHWPGVLGRSSSPSPGSRPREDLWAVAVKAAVPRDAHVFLEVFCDLWHLKSKCTEMASKVLFTNYYPETYACLQLNSQKKKHNTHKKPPTHQKTIFTSKQMFHSYNTGNKQAASVAGHFILLFFRMLLFNAHLTFATTRVMINFLR